MIESLLQFLTVIFTAALAENALFGRSLITRKMLFPSRKLEIILFALSVTGIIAISGLLCYVADIFLEPMALPLYLRSVVYIVLIILTHLAVNYFVEHRTELKTYRSYVLLQKTMLLASFNVAVLGTVLICSMNHYTLLMRIAYFIGTGIGVTGALLLTYVGRQNMTMSNVPKAFRGLPITLIYIGILSLAIYGLIGHQLPF